MIFFIVQEDFLVANMNVRVCMLKIFFHVNPISSIT